MEHNLRFLAGANAYQRLRTEGFQASAVRAILGASGGPKWFVLSQLDRVLAQQVLPYTNAPVHLVGSSIGAWRMACYARKEPLAAIAALEDAYVHQEYAPTASGAEITTVAREWLGQMLGTDGAGEVLASPQFRLHVITARAKRLSARESRLPLLLGLAAAASSNALNRRRIGRHFERNLFSDPRTAAPFADIEDGIPTVTQTLTAQNLVPAILASSAIPLLMPGVRDIPGAPSGVHRDGGIVDYHIDLPVSDDSGIALYPHFVDHLVPGWFDKRMARRRASAANTRNTLLICPAPEFVARLPGGKIPDRTDFKRYTDAQRVQAWQDTIVACQALADELSNVLANDQLADRLEPLL
ncbi:MAG: patatin-like phospholipase family protein [Pseudomonadales bacterium]